MKTRGISVTSSPILKKIICEQAIISYNFYYVK